MKRTRTLYVSDLDGTLLTPRIDITRRTAEIVDELLQRGVLFTYATARGIGSAEQVAPNLRTCGPVVVTNGGMIVDPRTRQRLRFLRFGAEQVDTMRALLERHRLQALVYAMVDGVERVSWIAGQENPGTRAYHESRRGDPRFCPLSPREVHRLYEGEVFYFNCIGTREETAPLYEALRVDERFQCVYHEELYSKDYWCEIMPREATKANGVLFLKEYYGCDRLVCFGDGLNDLSMFAVADESYAVSNAVPDLKEIATGVIGSNEDDAVAEWLLQHAKP